MRNALRTADFFCVLTGILGLIFFNVWVYPTVLFARHVHTFQTKTLSLLAKRDKAPGEMRYVKKAIETVQTQTTSLARFTTGLAPFIPLNGFKRIADDTEALAVFSGQLDRLLGNPEEAHYALFFFNSYELRPGGGFIGSVGRITMKQYTLTRFTVEDVYEIDGQITDHHEPHFAVRNYLNQPNEFLRDSNFTPDFNQNVQKAIPYMRRLSTFDVDYDGAIGITTGAFEKLLALIGPVHLSDQNVTIDAGNFFEKTQRKIEGEFFPGSDQKRNLLQSLGNISIARLEELPLPQIISFLHSALEHKDIVLYVRDTGLEALVTGQNWAGTQIAPVRDYLYPVSANVGVNKVNNYIQSSMELQIVHKPPRQQRIFKTVFTNTSSETSPFGGIYKNYFQLYTPADTVLKNVTVDNKPPVTAVKTTDENGYRVYAVYVEVPPRKHVTVAITYESVNTTPYDFPYHLMVQKQIGSPTIPLQIIFTNGVKTILNTTTLESDREFILK